MLKLFKFFVGCWNSCLNCLSCYLRRPVQLSSWPKFKPFEAFLELFLVVELYIVIIRLPQSSWAGTWTELGNMIKIQPRLLLWAVVLAGLPALHGRFGPHGGTFCMAGWSSQQTGFMSKCKTGLLKNSFNYFNVIFGFVQ